MQASERDVGSDYPAGVERARGCLHFEDRVDGLVVQGAADAGDDRVRSAQRRVDVVGPQVGDAGEEHGALRVSRPSRHLEDPLSAVPPGSVCWTVTLTRLTA
jgi:hypothetical protein